MRVMPVGPLARELVVPENLVRLVAVLVKRLIVLDLNRVGMGVGTGTEKLCSWVKSNYPHLELIAGGGIRGPEDLPSLEAAGVSAVLIASALHDGKFGLPGAALSSASL